MNSLQEALTVEWYMTNIKFHILKVHLTAKDQTQEDVFGTFSKNTVISCRCNLNHSNVTQDDDDDDDIEMETSGCHR